MQRNRYHHVSWLHGLELFEAAFSTHTFARHAHEGFAIGAIAEGVGGYLCRGESMLLPAGSLSLMNPEEPHTGHAAAGSVRYNMLYASEAAVREVLDVRVLRGFREVAPPDLNGALTGAISSLAARLNSNESAQGQMGIEEDVHAVLALAFSQHGRVALRPLGRESMPVRRLLRLIDEGVREGAALSLTMLAGNIGLSPSYLIRSTKRATGVTPHGHVLRARLAHARRLILAGHPAAEVAVSAGFADQAHLIRQFRRHYGVTPGSLILH